MAQAVHFRAVVETVARHTPDVASYCLRAERPLPRFRPGQFIHLTLDSYDHASFWPDSRAFSVANSVADRRTLALTISRQGSYTSRILDELEAGSVVWGKGPYGEFTVGAARGMSHAVLIAGGTGITPFCAFMDAVLEQGSLPVDRVTLHYGARTPALLIYRDLADRCAARFPSFAVRYSAEIAPLESGVTPGVLDLTSIVAAVDPLAAAIFYLSGPKAMIDRFRYRLTDEFGVLPDRVAIDAWQ